MDPREVNLSKMGAENEAIHGILVKILEKWRAKIKAEEKEFEKTVIVSAQAGASDAYPSPAAKPKDTVLNEMVPLEETDGMSSKEKAEEEPAEGKELEKTIIVSPQAVTRDAHPSRAAKLKDSGLEETLVSMREIDRMSSKERVEEQPREDEFLEETIILKPRKVQGKDKDKVNG